jgi:demethylmenaquinone methyltransferase/2-methoxy-6-polyprenyl-1,4-benzoquinol methylase
MSDSDQTIQRLVEANPLREPVLRSAVQALQLPPGSHGLDVGCGIGLQAQLLADAVGLNGHVTGIDISPELLAYGEKMAEQAGFSGRITFREADALRLPFDDDSQDWAWSADCIGYPLGDLPPFLAELMRVVRPSGRIAILAWSSQQLLPGHPLLEARLNATCSAYIPYLQGTDPEVHFLRALRWFREAGLEDVQAGTLVGVVRSPLSEGVRTGLASLFEMLWGERQPGVTPEDWEAFQRLCRPGSAEFILDVPDYYAFFTYTMFEGRVPRGF